MDLKSTIAIILKDLEDARNIIDDLKSYPDVPGIQVELAKAKCRSAEEVIKILVEESERVDPSTTSTTSGQAGSGSDKIEEAEEPIEEKLEEKFEIEDNIIDEVVQPKEEKVIDEDAVKKQILADRFSKQSSINEKIANKRHNDEASGLSKIKPVHELTSAIGINERFMFIRELFNGNQDIYKSTLVQLDNTDSIDSAFGILAKAAPQSTSAESFDQLLDLVRRKLATE